MNTIEAIYENGVFRPFGKIDLKDGERVEISIRTDLDARDPAETLHEIAVDTGISDLAENIDYYLYGLPKQSDR